MVATTTDVEMTEVDVSTAMTVEDDLSETIEADDLSAIIVVTTAVIGIAPSATTTISLSDRNATDAVSQEEAAVAVQTTEGSNAVTTDAGATDLVAMTDAVVTEEETTDPTTEWMATGIAPSATMTTLHGELNATNVEPQRAVAEAGLLAEMTDVVATDLVAMTDAGATEEGTTDAAERCSTTTTGIALNATTPISHSVRNATDVDCLEAVVNPVLVETIGVVATEVAAMIDAAAADLVAMTEEVATEEVAMTDVVATEEVAMTDVVATEEVAMTDVVATEEVATEEVAMTDVVATEEVAMTDVVATADRLAVNLGNSVKLVERDQAMLTTDHLVI
jgi:hypothetical protein